MNIYLFTSYYLLTLYRNLFSGLPKTCAQFDAKLLGIGQNQKANIC